MKAIEKHLATTPTGSETWPMGAGKSTEACGRGRVFP